MRFSEKFDKNQIFLLKIGKLNFSHPMKKCSDLVKLAKIFRNPVGFGRFGEIS